MSSNNNSAFFLNRIPQSEYRRIGPSRRESDTQGKYELSLSLKKLKLKDKKKIGALRKRIRKETEHVLKTLLPEDAIEIIDIDGYLHTIYENLGLTE